VITRRIYRFLVVLTALLTVALGLFAAISRAPAALGQRTDTVSAIQPHDQSAVIAPERRVTRVGSLNPVDPPVTVLVGGLAGLVALVAVATGRLAPEVDRIARRGARSLAWSLRGPPEHARVTLVPAS
jgi:hypothetical protein